MDGIGQLEDAKAVEREQAVQLDQGKNGNWWVIMASLQATRSSPLAVLGAQRRACVNQRAIPEECSCMKACKEIIGQLETKIKLKNFQKQEFLLQVVSNRRNRWNLQRKVIGQSTGLTSDLTENRIWITKRAKHWLERWIECNCSPCDFDESIIQMKWLPRVKELPLKWDGMQLSKRQMLEQ